VPSACPRLAAAHKCDVNGDGRIDTADALLAAQMVQTGVGDPREAARADVAPPNDLEGGDGDGVVSGPDLLLILRAISGDDVKSCDHTLS
jgi:hypothetical protein